MASKQNVTSTNELEQLSPTEKERYARHLAIPEVGESGQLNLKRARILLVGAGGLGAPIALYLAASGVGHLTIVDHDQVSLSNLQRQVLFTTSDVGQSKARLTKSRLNALNPEVEVQAVSEKLTTQNARELIKQHDLIIDGTDNFATRYLINDACLLEKKSFVFGAIFRFDAQVSLFGTPNGPCYRCLYPEAPGAEASPNCAEAGVLGVLPGTAGLLMATEATKYILKIGEPLAGKILQYDALSTTFYRIAVAKRDDCQSCGPKSLLKDLSRHESRASEASISAIDFRNRAAEAWILDVRNEDEFASGHWRHSHLIPLAQLATRIGEIPSDRDLIVVCQSGKRSARAVEILHAHGYTRASTVDGGLNQTGLV